MKVDKITEKEIPNNLDILVLFGGFEDRVLAIKKILCNKFFKYFVMMRYINQPDVIKKDNQKNIKALKTFFKANREEYLEINVYFENLSKTINSLKNQIIEKLKKKRVSIAIDISGCSTPIIHSFFHFIFTYSKHNKTKFHIYLFYTKPKKYGVFDIHEVYPLDDDDYKVKLGIMKKDQDKEKKLVQPYVSYVHPVLNYFGKPDSLKRNILFLFIGFERYRSEALIIHYLPIKTYFLLNINSDDAEQKKNVKTAIKLHEDLITEDNILDIEFYDLEKITFQLEKYVKNFIKEYNIIIGCFGSKIQTIAASIIAYNSPEITLANAKPESYSPRDYSDGIGQTLMFKITAW